MKNSDRNGKSYKQEIGQYKKRMCKMNLKMQSSTPSLTFYDAFNLYDFISIILNILTAFLATVQKISMYRN